MRAESSCFSQNGNVVWTPLLPLRPSIVVSVCHVAHHCLHVVLFVVDVVECTGSLLSIYLRRCSRLLITMWNPVWVLLVTCDGSSCLSVATFDVPVGSTSGESPFREAIRATDLVMLLHQDI